MALSSDDWPRFSLLVGATNVPTAPTPPTAAAANAAIGAHSNGASATYHLQPASDVAARELLDVAYSLTNTWECWLQLRVVVSTKIQSQSQSHLQTHTNKREYSEGGSCCWIVWTPSWACGVDSDGAFRARVGDTLYTTVAASVENDAEPMREGLEASFRLQTVRWYHFAGKRTPLKPMSAVVYPTRQALELFIDGRRVPLIRSCSKSHSLSSNTGTSSDFQIGVSISSPQTNATVSCVLHDFRVWRSAIDESTLAAWMTRPVSVAHRCLASLVAHWELSSGAVASDVELDLSGNARHLCTVRTGVKSSSSPTACWLRIAPPRLKAAQTDFVVEALQDSSRSDSECRFLVTIRHRDHLPTGRPSVSTDTQQQETQRRPCILFVCNFLCFKSASVSNSGEGKWIVALLKECVRSLPESTIVGLLATSNLTTNQQSSSSRLFHPPAFMTSSGKSLTCKALDQLSVTSTLDSIESLVATMESGIRTFLDSSAELKDAAASESAVGGALVFTSVVVINSSLLNNSSAANPEMYEQSLKKLEANLGVDAERLSISFLHLHPLPKLLTSEKGPKSSKTTTVVTSSFGLFTEYAGCAQDFEWALGSVMVRISQVSCTNARLRFQVFEGDDTGDEDGGENLTLDSSSRALTAPSADESKRRATMINFGLCAQSEALLLSGTFSITRKFHSTTPFVELSFQYLTHDRQLQVARVSIRLRQDLTSDMHVARMQRNRALLLLEGDNTLLLEQRRRLMDEKGHFHRALVTREVGELENGFKRVNTMKEELWAKRKWIVQRGLRCFEESELCTLGKEALAVSEAIQKRFERLQAVYTANAHENSRGTGGGNGTGNTSRRVQTESYYEDHRRRGSSTKAVNGGDQDENGEKEQEVLAERFEKLSLKVDLLSTQFRDLESRMEDMQHSIRVSQVKGFVIMNDTRKSWTVLFHDLLTSKRKVMDMTREQASTEFALVYFEHKQAAIDQMLLEIKKINSTILKYEKEHAKRKKRVFFCMKDVLSVVQLEAESALELENVRRTVRQCKLLRSPALDDPALYSSCIHVFFSLNVERTLSVTGVSSHRLNNTVHALFFGLRHFCHEATQLPFCRRIALQENFLWLDQEQLRTDEDDLEVAAQNDWRGAQVQQESWAVIIFTYNALFTSPAAVSELKKALSCAEQKRKQVLHIQLEDPLTSLDAFKGSVKEHDTSKQQLGSPPVEKQYLIYKQNLTIFQTALARIRTTTPSAPTNGQSGSLSFAPLEGECARCSVGAGGDIPCLPCCWSTISRSTHHTIPPLHDPNSNAFLQMVSSMGQWIDELALSATTHAAVKSHNIDPKSSSPLFLRLESFWSEELNNHETLWEESFSRRKGEISRQLLKLSKVNEEEANELVQLRFALTKRKQTLCSSCTERFQSFQEELKLLRTLAELKSREEQSETALQARELALMTDQEVVQMLGEADQLMATLDKLEEDEDTASEETVAQVKQVSHEALKRSVQKILELGKQCVDNQLRATIKSYVAQQECDEMERLKIQSEFEMSEIRRVESVFSQGLDIVSRLIAERKQEIVDEARAFVLVSRLEQRKLSTAVDGGDLNELRKHARDVDEQSSFRVSVLVDKLLSELMIGTAEEFRLKAGLALQVFESFYTPSPGFSELSPHPEKDSGSLPASVPPEVLKLKEFCSLSLENPHETWGSLQRMKLVAESELLNVRHAKSLVSDFKMHFESEFVGSQLERSQIYSQQYVRHLTELFARVNVEKDQSLQRRLQCKRALRTAIEDRGQCEQRTLALQSKLTNAKARNRYLLQLLQECRGSYEKALRMSDRLANFKMHPLFKGWFAVGEFHTSSVAGWFDLRASCAEDVATLENEVGVLERQLERLNDSVEQKRLQWMKESIADVEVCERAEQLQDLVHKAVSQVVETEEARVFHLLSCFDLRYKWLEKHDLKLLHTGSKGMETKGDSANQNLVQLSIARLDSIKQEKLFDSLVRKLRVYERIWKQEAEKQQMVSNEIERHRALSERLLQRVRFVMRQVERVEVAAATFKSSDYPATTSTSNEILVSRTKGSGVDSPQLVAARQELEALKISASKDHLVTEAHLCQLCWRLQAQIATSHRIDTAIQRLAGKIQAADKYLMILKATDSALYHQGISSDDGDRDESPELATQYGERIRSRLPFVLNVFEYYTRQRWSTQALERTTQINAKLRTCEDRLALLSTSKSSGANDALLVDATDEDAKEQMRESLENEATTAELELLLNRFECRIAEHSSEALWDKLDAFGNNSNSDCTQDLQVVNSAISIETLSSWLFSTKLCLVQKRKALSLLRKVTTDADARDVGGNIAEVVYGASLDSNEIKQIYLTTRSSHMIDEQWRVTCLVVLFFARLFRRAALQKAAKQRKLEAAALMYNALTQQQEHCRFADAVGSLSFPSSGSSQACSSSKSVIWNPLLELLKGRGETEKKRLKACIRLLQLEHQERGIANVLAARITDGLILARPLHHVLSGLYDPSHEVQTMELRLEHAHAEFKYQPPKPSGLELVSAENNAIKVKWTPLRNDADLLYAAEIQHWKPSFRHNSKRVENTKVQDIRDDDPQQTSVQDLGNPHGESGGGPYWDLFVSDSKQSHTFFNLQSGETYCVRVRSGFSKSKWGKASYPLFVTLKSVTSAAN